MNYTPNTKRWQVGDVVIHDADAKMLKMLMRVVGLDVENDLVMTEYIVDDRPNRRNRIMKNDFRVLHDPAMFNLDTRLVNPGLSLTQYQRRASLTAVYPGSGEDMGLAYVALGLTGEAGEIANKAKKLLRGDDNADELREALRAEVGDVLWYVAMLCGELGVMLEDVAQSNLNKLNARKTAGTLKGTGDER